MIRIPDNGRTVLLYRAITQRNGGRVIDMLTRWLKPYGIDRETVVGAVLSTLPTGVMHWGVVVAECHEPEHAVKVRFEVDGKVHWTFPDHIARGR